MLGKIKDTKCGNRIIVKDNNLFLNNSEVLTHSVEFTGKQHICALRVC